MKRAEYVDKFLRIHKMQRMESIKARVYAAWQGMVED